MHATRESNSKIAQILCKYNDIKFIMILFSQNSQKHDKNKQEKLHNRAALLTLRGVVCHWS